MVSRYLATFVPADVLFDDEQALVSDMVVEHHQPHLAEWLDTYTAMTLPRTTRQD